MLKGKKGARLFWLLLLTQGIAQQVADYLGCFDQVIATHDNQNLRGERKLAAIRTQVGEEFVYAGDHQVDLPIWVQSKGAIVVGNQVPKLVAKIQAAHVPIEQQWANPKASLMTWLKAIRIHQWLKNILLFVPLLTAFLMFDLAKFSSVCLAFLAFSLGASATYILNDLWDLGNDRQHARKCKRPFAAAVLSIPQGVKAAGLLLLIGLVLSAWVSWAFLATFLVYLILTTLYSLKLKKQILLDIITLSVLYTIRIFSGGVVADINLSYWLVAFSVLVFLSLATVKRCAELVAMPDNLEKIVGRGYVKSDLAILWPLGIGAYMGAVIMFGLYINAPETTMHYTHPSWLWLVQLIMVYLIGNLWMNTKRGLMHDDPIVFLIRDKKSLGLVFLCVSVMLLAKLIK